MDKTEKIDWEDFDAKYPAVFQKIEAFIKRTLVPPNVEKFQENPQSQLFHYTDAQGLLKILTNKTVRATDLRFMNDMLEIVYARELVEKVFGATLDSLNANPFEDIKPFAFCMCQEGDDLHLWRAYGGEAGYAIGFAVGGIAEALIKLGWPGLQFVRVVYNSKLQEQTAEGVLTLFQKLAKGIDPSGANAFHAHLPMALAPMLYSFKNPSFRGEMEWRLVVSMFPEQQLKKVSFRTSGRHLIPHIDVPLVVQGEGRDLLPIKSITIGPARASKTDQNAVELLLARLGYSDVEVKVSKISLRP